jgi:hypothetical protein
MNTQKCLILININLKVYANTRLSLYSLNNKYYTTFLLFFMKEVLNFLIFSSLAINHIASCQNF